LSDIDFIPEPPIFTIPSQTPIAAALIEGVALFAVVVALMK
jgi:F0F1-type ATP synthase membrane subunit c/vacuolar-type H+-ATPase subunit K